MLALAALCFAAGDLFGQQTNAARVAIRGDVEKPVELSLADLQGMPREKVQITDHDGNNVTYEGVSLWNVIERAKLKIDGRRNGAIARGWVVVKAADKYEAVFALAELDPGFTDNKIILVDAQDGKALNATQGPFEIIVPSDKARARWVRQVMAVDVVFRKAETKQ